MKDGHDSAPRWTSRTPGTDRGTAQPRGCKSSLKCYQADPKSSEKEPRATRITHWAWPVSSGRAGHTKHLLGPPGLSSSPTPTPTPKSLPAGGGALANPTGWQNDSSGGVLLTKGQRQWTDSFILGGEVVPDPPARGAWMWVLLLHSLFGAPQGLLAPQKSWASRIGHIFPAGGLPQSVTYRILSLPGKNAAKVPSPWAASFSRAEAAGVCGHTPSKWQWSECGSSLRPIVPEFTSSTSPFSARAPRSSAGKAYVREAGRPLPQASSKEQGHPPCPLPANASLRPAAKRH